MFFNAMPYSLDGVPSFVLDLGVFILIASLKAVRNH